MGLYEPRPHRDHGGDPAISLYLLSDDGAVMDKLSCIWCKRTVIDIKGRVDSAINTPMPVTDYGIAINIRCKLCHANYRLLVNAYDFHQIT